MLVSSVGQVVDQSPLAAHELFPVCDDGDSTSVRHAARSTSQTYYDQHEGDYIRRLFEILEIK